MAHITDETTLKEKKKIEAKEKASQTNFDEAMKAIGQTQNGRDLLWKILSHCKPIGSSIFNPNALTQSYLAGKQDVGNWLLGEILRIDEKIYIQMMTDRQKGA